jgi:hypothetical protein
MVKILLKDVRTQKVFEKKFDCEFDRDKFLRKLRYAKNIVLVNSYKNNFCD